MPYSIPIPGYANLTNYNHIQAVRQTDGAIIRAQRVVVDENTPIRWTIVVTDRVEKYLYIEAIKDNVRETYSTAELLELAKQAGFGEWQQSQVSEMEAFVLTAEGYQQFIMQQYQLPDFTVYPID